MRKIFACVILFILPRLVLAQTQFFTPITVDEGDAIDTNTQGVVMMGTDGVPGVAYPLLADSSGLTVQGSLTCNAGTNLNTSALALDSSVDGVEALLTTIDADTSNIDTSLNVIKGAYVADAGALGLGVLIQGDDGSVRRNLSVDTSGNLQVDIVSGGSSGAQYTEGDTDATITGNAMMWEDAGDTLAAVSASKPLPIDITDSSLPVTQSGTWNLNNISGTISLPTGASTSALQSQIDSHVDGVEALLNTIDTDTSNIDTSLNNIEAGFVAEAGALGTGVLLQGDDGLARKNVAVDASGNLQVDIVSGGSSGAQYTEGDTDSTITGTAMLWEDGGDTLATISAASPLPIDVTNATIAATQSGTWDIGDITGTVSLPTGAATAALQSQIDSHVDGVEALLNTIDADTGNIDTSLNNIEAGYAAEAAALGSGVLLQGDDGSVRRNVAVDTSGNLQVDIVSGGASGTEYTEGDTDTTITGTAIMWEDAANTLASVSASKPLPIDITDTTVAVTQSGSWTSVGVTDGGGSLTVDGTVAATQSGTWNINNVSGTVSLPTGAATAANQTTIIGHVDGLETLIGTTNTNTSNINAKFTAAAALSDNQANPTTTRVGAALQAWDGATWDRVPGTSTDGLLVNLGANNDISGTVTCNAGTNLNTSALALDASVDGIETQLTAMQSTLSGISTSVGIMDDWDISDRAKTNIKRENAGCTTLTAINTTYDNSTTSANSADVDVSGYDMCTLVLTLVSANTPTDIQIQPQGKNSSTYFDMTNGFLGNFIFDDTSVATARNMDVSFPCSRTGTMRVAITATGTTSTNTFTISNAALCPGS